MNKVAIFINDSQAYLDTRVKETYTEWGFSYSDMIKIEEWDKSAPFQGSLFSKRFVLLDITNEKRFSKFKEVFDKDKGGKYFKSNWYGDGVIIIAKNGRGTWLSKIAEYSDGLLEKKIDISEIKKEFNKEYRLRADVLNVVLDTIGDDTTVYTVIKNSLSKLSENEIRDLTVEDIISFLPKKKGEVAPWELIRAVFMKDIDKVLSEYDRVTINTHPMVLLSLLRNKFSLLAKYKLLREEKYSEQDILKLVGGKSVYIFKDFKSLNISTATANNCVKLILKYEHLLKGGSRGNIGSELLPELLTKLVISLQSNTSKIY